MPPLPAVAGVARVDLLWTVGSDLDVLTRLHFDYTGGPPSPTDCATLAGLIDDDASGIFPALLHPDNTFRGVDFIDLSGPLAATGTALVTNIGTRTGGNLPAGVAVIVDHKIARRYRGGKPRSYLPVFTATDLENPSEWAPASVTAMNAAWAAFVAGVLGLSSGSTTMGAPSNISYYSGYGAGRPRSNGHLYYPPALRAVPIHDPITGSTTNPKPGSQRRRNLHSS